jgi:UPF0716 family protein affecting phage T7 exclusion
MLHLLAFFLPPAALLLAGKPIQAIINLCVYVLAWIAVVFLIFPGFICWAIAVLHAILVINSKRADQRTKEVVQAIALKSDNQRVS